MDDAIFNIPFEALNHIDRAWTFFLILTRFASLIMFLPGIGQGPAGLTVRMPAIIVFSIATVINSPVATLPSDMAIMAAQVFSEMILGGLIGLIPLMVVSGAQCAGQIASGSMGLNGAQLFDPTTNVAVPDLARLYGDLTVGIFLVLGGHYAAIQAIAGLGTEIIPGTYLISENGLAVLIDRSAHVFLIGCMLSAPVFVALLMTNFVMGLVSRAVPTVNIFIVSFPLSIGVGLILSMLALPEFMVYLQRDFMSLEKLWDVVIG